MPDDEYPVVDAAGGDRPSAADTLRDGTYVRFCAGLAVLAEADRVIVAGGLRRHMLTGSDACRVATELIPVLDGRRTVSEACRASGMTEQAASQAISTFRGLGLVEYADRPFQDHATLASHVSAFLSRAVHAAGTYRNSQDSQEALATSAVVVLAGAPIATPLRADLLACGIRSVVIGDAEDVKAVEAAIVAAARWPHHLVLGVEDPSIRTALTSTEATCREQAVPFLRAARDGTTAELGPLFLAGYTACYECFNQDHAEDLPGRPGETALPHDADSRALDEAFAAMIAEETLAVLGHVRTAQTYRAVSLISLTGDDSDQRLTFVPRSDCAVCGALSPCQNEADVAGIYEWEVQGMPRLLFPPGAQTAQAALARPDIVELATRRASFPAGPSYPLASEAEMYAPTSFHHGMEVSFPAQLGPAHLARILIQVGGRRAPGHRGDLRRWAPSGGNLASVRLYTVAAGSGFGVTAGRLTVYDDIEHRLIMVRAGQASMSQVLAGTGLAAAEPAVAIVFVADVARIARKYGSFGYRLCHLDAGVAAAQLIAVAQELGLTVTFASSWSASLADFLELLPDQEYVTTLAVLSPREGEADATDS